MRSLRGPALHARAAALHQAGWSLAAIGEALDPPKTRSAVRAWVTRPLTSSPQTDTFPLPSPSPSSDSSDSSDSTFPAAENLHLSSSPSSSAATSSASSALSRHRRYGRFDPEKPRLSPYAANRIRELAPIAKRYRSGMSDYSEPAQANMELTIVCRSSFTSGVSIRELAIAAGVSYNAMQRRVNR